MMKDGSPKSMLWALGSLGLIPLIGTIYVHLNHAGGISHSLVTDLDRQLPFLPVFVIPYLSWYVFLAVSFVYLICKHQEVYYRTLIQFLAGLLLCYGIYAVYQTYVPRPEVTGTGTIQKLMGWVYDNDEPFNCFPSTHVLTSYLIMKAYWGSVRIPKLYRVAVTGMSLLIIISTQFVKQHVLLDIVGAVIIAEGLSYAVNRWLIFKRPVPHVGTSLDMGTIGIKQSLYTERAGSVLQGGLRK
ncbi:phosphatase PAP2 family protein [Paenibacillus hexagrammi]|uniref:Phosphatase PAP2 family protein n=1 Tax=Paenibacillus hexagrammi TaxID=2908839 RepID=A0ABY3SL73_9BACL|nr:phosphatase PAP2 family protein [Paenibacillus sp. YPD9-1]UJF33969.1 phosphatase PAP2 family protein [Paenibacillus sp. YPD9-1]